MRKSLDYFAIDCKKVGSLFKIDIFHVKGRIGHKDNLKWNAARLAQLMIRVFRDRDKVPFSNF